MTTYATAVQLEDYLGTAVPDDAERLLQRASELIESFFLGPYDVDDVTGFPSDERIAGEVAKAACAQVEYWLQTGDEADVLTGRTSVSFNGAMFMSGKGRRLAPRAADALGRAGLLVGVDAL
jgi:hypothetical protein